MAHEGVNQAALILRNATAHAVAQVTELATGAVVVLLISRNLHASGLGVYATVMTYYGLLRLVAEMGASNLLARDIGRDRSQTNVLVIHMAAISLAAAALLSVAGTVAIPLFGYEAATSTSLQIVLVGLIPGALRSILEAVFVGYQRVEFVTGTTMPSAVAIMAVDYWLLQNGYGVASLVAAFVAVQFLIVVAYLILMGRWIYRPRFTFCWTVAVKIFHESKPFAATAVLAALVARPEILILSLVGTSAQVGYFGAATKVVDLWQVLPTAFMANVFPVLSRSVHRADRTAQAIQDSSIKYLLAASLPLAVGIVVTAPTIVSLLYGPDFEEAVPVLRLLAASVPLTCVQAVLWRVLAARDEQGSVLRVQCLTVAGRLGVGYALASVFGVTGAAAAASGGLLLHSLLLSQWIRRDGTRLRIIQLGWRFGLASLGMGIVAWAVQDHVQVWALLFLAAGSYLLLAYLFRAVSLAELVLLRRVLLTGTLGGM